MVIRYQYGAPDIIDPCGEYDINGAYVDGVSVTRDNSRQHIWTFMVAIQELVCDDDCYHKCLCAPNSPLNVPSFIGNDYFCESGYFGHYEYNMFYSEDPLWDGKQCGLIEKGCCQASGPPWFNKTFNSPTTDYIEMRVCSDQVSSNEDSPVSFYEIYVK